jgi:uncharacterized membrane protein
MKPKNFLNQLQNDEIVAAIRQAEKQTSGEIRVFISSGEPEDAIKAAQAEFTRLGMDKTAEKNGVLIYVAPHVHKFAVIGDAGVHQKCGETFWTAVAAEMSGHFKKERFTEGIMHGVKEAGSLLARHFPHKSDDRNELPDEIAGD